MNPEISPKKENFLKELVKFTLIAIVIVIPLRTFVAQPFIVKGPSMNPTFADNQYLIVDQLTYHFHNPERQDVIVMRFPLNPKVFFIKRIIGLPGESLSIHDGIVTVVNRDNPQGMVVEAPYVENGHASHDNFSLTLGPEEYFVMGDNRSESSDSRSWGPLEKKFIIGRPILRLFPPSNIGVFPGKL